jgi:hypothetical protein
MLGVLRDSSGLYIQAEELKIQYSMPQAIREQDVVCVSLKLPDSKDLLPD